jgi:hypothetical protein
MGKIPSGACSGRWPECSNATLLYDGDVQILFKRRRRKRLWSRGGILIAQERDHPGRDRLGEHTDLGTTQDFNYKRHIPCPPSSRRSTPVKVTVQLIVYDDDGYDDTVTEVVVLEKPCQQLEQVGLPLTEANPS